MDQLGIRNSRNLCRQRTKFIVDRSGMLKAFSTFCRAKVSASKATARELSESPFSPNVQNIQSQNSDKNKKKSSLKGLFNEPVPSLTRKALICELEGETVSEDDHDKRYARPDAVTAASKAQRFRTFRAFEPFQKFLKSQFVGASSLGP